MEKERLDRFLSNQLNIPRSKVKVGIKHGSAAVNGIIVRDIGYFVDIQNDTVTYDGKKVKYKRFIYLVLNKPSGLITASKDKSQRTVLDLVPQTFRRRNLAPVGRLDKDTTGLLILTDDGDFAHRCISPKSEIEKSYIVELDGDIDESIIKGFKTGVVLSDGYRCKPAKLWRLSHNKARVVITEGKYHQIKRMFGVFFLGVNHLHRESIGNLKLPQTLAEGECIEVDDIERKIVP